MGKFATLVGSVNTLITAPFRTKMPVVPIALLFVLALIVSAQWRLILDRVEEVVA